MNKTLVCDVGGTKILFGLMHPDHAGKATIRRKQTILVRNVESFTHALALFLEAETELRSIERVVIGAAGPSELERATITNLDWQINAHHVEEFLRDKFSLNVKVSCYNDMVLQALGCLHTYGAHRTLLFPDAHEGVLSPVSVLAIGTGLGEGFAVPVEKSWRAFGSEGGHATFGVVEKEDVEFLEFLTKYYDGHVSWERVVSGIDGFRNLWDFARQKSEYAHFSLPEIHEKYGPALSQRIKEGCPVAQYVFQKMSYFLGMEASNHVLKIFSKGGLYLSGTVAQALLPEFKNSFYEGFLLKGRFKDLLQKVPVYLITDPDVTLTGGFYL